MIKMTIYINLPVENGDGPVCKALSNQRVYKYIASPDHVNAENTLGTAAYVSKVCKAFETRTGFIFICVYYTIINYTFK